MKKADIISIATALWLVSSAAIADDHEHEHGEKEAGHSDEATISEKAAQELAIEIDEAHGAKMQETLSVTGRVTLNQNHSAQIRARFPGIVRSMVKEPGERVVVGDLLATIESNASLQDYQVKSPIAGTVITRSMNIGEFAADAPLYQVADLRQLWAELFVFSKDSEQLKPGQKVHIQCLDDPVSVDATIAVVLPTTETSSQTVVARVVIDNPNNHWRPGMNIRADIVLNEKDVPVAIKSEAIQRMEGKNVVFIEHEPNSYKAQAVELGISNGSVTEILHGLVAGQRYVAKNSFVVKAEIGKASAQHEH